ncbi:hypothetical protein B0A49_07607 [Cryomyces minteri]|uniref:Integral membrane protein n=1 Tax=Cryomyces minteri TaxID=331657 RepID=A0A4U0XC50_9PEZI|nr:hypothetical protein B0A49_07607 [Cryomyces minteri]
MMARNTGFYPNHEPLRQDSSLKLRHERVSGPFSFLNPTRAHFRHVDRKPVVEESQESGLDQTPGESPDGREQAADDFEYKWTSRNNRKGRHAIAVTPAKDEASAKYETPPSSTSPRAIVKGIWRMCVYYPIWDVSYDVAAVFTLGSVVWVINAFFVWLPLQKPSTAFADESLYGGGITAFIGATIFEFGCLHHHTDRKNFVGRSATTALSRNSNPALSSAKDSSKSWVWFPSFLELRTHYLHELGFLACLAQLIGASIFWIAGLNALPGINDRLSPGALDGIYWTPQVVGGCGFIVSGTLFMLETQEKWWKPALGTLGWHIGFWNWIGGIGFTLSPAFGYDTSEWALYQACLSTFWGSWAFLIGSVLQWYESLDKHPVDVEPSSAEP